MSEENATGLDQIWAQCLASGFWCLPFTCLLRAATSTFQTARESVGPDGQAGARRWHTLADTIIESEA